ncbi:MAG: T9SS type A sorting domain-containing protein [Flavitalea sp.]
MKSNLRNYVCGALLCFCATQSGFAQSPGQPAFQSATRNNQLPKKSFSKLSPDLKRLIQKDQRKDVDELSRQSATPKSNGMERLIQLVNGQVIIDITVAGNIDSAKKELISAGAKITGSFGRIISAVMPLSAIDQLERSSQVRFVKPAYRPKHTGTIDNKKNIPVTRIENTAAPSAVKTIYSQGDTAQGSHLARKNSRVNGKGVKVGIMSDSYNVLGGAATGVKNGELPGATNPYKFTKAVEVLNDLESGGSDEGRAMAEIVHDVAPGADLAFSTAFLGEAAFAQGIVELANVGCRVITDDIFYFAEPYFQDGVIAQAIDQVVKRGVTYFSAAGNLWASSYEEKYQKSNKAPFGTLSGTAHNFAKSGRPPVYYQPVEVPVNGVFTIGLQWDDPFFSAGGASAKTDMDIYILDQKGEIISASTTDNIGSGDPIELAGFINETGNTTFYIAILKVSGPDPSRIKYVLFDNGTFVADADVPGQFKSALTGHANSAGAITVAAAGYNNTPAYGSKVPLVQDYSSLGGTQIIFDPRGSKMLPVIRRKPDFTAPDGGNNSFFSGDDIYDKDNYPNFYGTSAAAPHAAGVAALMIEAQKLNTLTPESIRGILKSRTYDMDNPGTPGFDKGFDHKTGTGLIRAELAVADVKFPNRYVNNLSIENICTDNPSKERKWKIINPNSFDVEVRWSVVGFNQTATVKAPPGNYQFATTTGNFRSYSLPNVMLIDWKDNLGYTRIDLAASSANKCGQRFSLWSSGEASTLAPDAMVAEVFPNPSVNTFNISLSLDITKPAELQLISVDGRTLYRNRVAAKGVHRLNATAYKPGIYFLKVTNGDFVKTLKLIKQ